MPQVDVVTGVGYDRAAALGAAGRFHHLRHVVTNLGVLDFETPDHRMRLRSVHPGVTVDEIVAATGFELVVPDDVPETRAPTPDELELIREVHRPAQPARQGSPEPVTARGAAARAPASCSACEYPIVQTGMGWVAGARLTAATSAAGGLGILASATMDLDRARDRDPRRCKERTDNPFGVNLRSDQPDVDRPHRPHGRDRREGRELRPGAGRAAGEVAQGPGRRGDADGRRPPPRREGRGLGRRRGDRAGRRGRRPHRHRARRRCCCPQVCDAVDIPVLAAGGFFDGRGLVARARVRRGRRRDGHALPALARRAACPTR